MTIAESLKRFRNNFKLTQKDVASKIGIAQQAYYRYEADKNIPSAEIIISIANAYDVSTDYLLGRCDDPRGINVDSEIFQAALKFSSELQKILAGKKF